MEWEPMAHYLIERGFSISPRICERFMASFGRRAKQERIPYNQRITHQPEEWKHG